MQNAQRSLRRRAIRHITYIVLDMTTPADVLSLRGIIRRLVPGRAIDGIAAVLLPFRQNDEPDFETFARLVEHTYEAGLTPAVNVETGAVDLLSSEVRDDVLA